MHISGRIKNMIVLGTGKKVFPEEVEAVIEESPYIKEMAVIGRHAARSARKGHEEVYAVIVPELDAFGQEERVDALKIKRRISSEITRLGKNLAKHKRITDFEIREEPLPRTVTKKVKRKALTETFNKQ